jgi:hypothetical protein
LSGDSASFDAGNGTWVSSVNSTHALVTSTSRTGAGCMSITATASGNANVAHVTAGSITTGGLACVATDIIHAECWVKAATTVRAISVGAEFYTSGGTLISSAYGQALNDSTSAWTRIIGTINAPATAAYCRMSVKVASAAAGEVHYIDDAILRNMG